MSREAEPLVTIRKLLLGALALGVLGTAGELVLLRHIDKPAQWVPLVMLGLSLPLLMWHALRPGPRSVRSVQVLMAGFIAAGVAGVGLHFDGNAEFEAELHPTVRGFEWLRQTAAGATPVLAPGSMVLLGLVGLAHTYQHPSTTGPSGQERYS